MWTPQEELRTNEMKRPEDGQIVKELEGGFSLCVCVGAGGEYHWGFRN